MIQTQHLKKEKSVFPGTKFKGNYLHETQDDLKGNARDNKFIANAVENSQWFFKKVNC